MIVRYFKINQIFSIFISEWSEESTEAEESIDGDIEAEAESEEDDVKENKVTMHNNISYDNLTSKFVFIYII